MGRNLAAYGAEEARAIGKYIRKALATTSILYFFLNGENHEYLKYLIELIAGSSEMVGKIAECDAEGTLANRNRHSEAVENH